MPFAPDRPDLKTSAPVANTAATVTFSATIAGATTRVHIRSILASYSAAPTGGGLTITDGITTVAVDIPASGVLNLAQLDLRFAPGTAVVVTLLAGTGAVLGKLAATATYEI